MTSRSLGHRAPLLWLVVPMIAGLVAARVTEFTSMPLALCAAIVVAAVAMWSAWRKPTWFRPALCVTMFLAGVASYSIHRPRLAEWKQLPPREARLTLAVQRAFPQTDLRQVSGLGIVRAADAHLADLVGQRVYFSVNLRKEQTAPVRSSVISTVGVLTRLPDNAPANSFDGYLANAGVNFRFARGRLLGEVAPAHPYYRFCERQAERFVQMLDLGIATKRPELAAVLRAMLLGRHHELSDDHETLFKQTGTMHVFSISGLHIAVIAGGLHAVLLLLRLPAVARFGLGLVALWLYVDITGAAPSAVRAFIMVAMVESAFVLRLPRNPIAALAGSALLVLLFAPLQVFSASFQLSYGIVAALLTLGLPLADRWQERLALFRDLPKVTWRPWHHALNAAWCAILGATALGLAASLVSAIAGVIFFKLLTPGALLANLWLIPAATAVILAGFISLLCGLVGFGSGCLVANHAAAMMLWLIEHGVRAFAQLPGAWLNAEFRAEWLGPAAFALLLATLFSGYARRWQGWHRGYWTPFTAVALALLFGVRLI